MNNDETEELIKQLQETRKDLASNLYRDFFTDGRGGLAGDGKSDEGSTAADENVAQNGTAGKTDSDTSAAGSRRDGKPDGDNEEDPMETLNSLVGLKTIKHDVKELADFAKIQKTREEAGLKTVPVSLHLVFTGNPGTGKTTVARILAKLYARIGILSKGQLVETDRSGLVAGYVGQTALKTQAMIQKALGGVLFIDEAYTLTQNVNDFGQEAVDTILKAMEDHREDLIVIVAGYTRPMQKFIESNPGLKSRFNKYIEFPDYTIDELMEIFDLDLSKYDYTMKEETRAKVREELLDMKAGSADNFANARAVRNLFENVITNQARRVASLQNPSSDDLRLITDDDLSDPDD